MKPTWPPLAELSSALQKKRAPLRFMDSVDVCAATSTADSNNNKRRVHSKTNGDWLNRLHLRKAALQPPAMQTPDKQQHGPKKIAAATAAAKHAKTKRPNHEELQRIIHGGNGNALRFKCSYCMDGVERAPKDLSKHCDEKHKGCPPVFSCHMCKFTTHEFSYLQVHVLSHKDTFSCCSLCKDDVQRTWAEFSAHLTMVHTRNGKYTCEVCKKYSTSDDKEFLEHVLLHNLGLDMKSEQAMGKMTTYRCQFCSYEASQKIILTKHMKAVHGNVNQRTADLSAFSDPKSKPRMTRSAVKDISWLTQDCLSLPGREFLNKYCHLSDAKTTLEETEQFLIKSGKPRWSVALKNVLSNVPRQDAKLHSKLENVVVSVSPDSSQDVLTAKNKMNQNGGSFAKRLKLTTEKEVESADPDSCERILSDSGFSVCLQNQDLKLNSKALINESTEGPSLRENRENHRLKTHLNDRNGEEIVQDGDIADELKAEERNTVRKALPKKKRKNMHWKNMKKNSRKSERSQRALALKIVLKKNPKTGKQWVTQSSKTVPCPSKCSSTIGEMKKCDKTIRDNHKTVDRGAEKIQDGGRLEERNVLLNGIKGKSRDKSEAGADSAELKVPDGSSEASPLARPVITAQIEIAQPSVPRLVGRTQDASSLHGSSSTSEASPSPPPLTPKTLERTLHLVALSSEQPVKRPTGVIQPVVVLNHPDAEISEVCRIMEVVKKHKGQIHKVVLSKQTLNAIEERGRSPETDSTGVTKNHVRERFLLKMKLRKLSRKKYEVVNGEASSNRGRGGQAFRCWFCGRAFVSREVWLSHKQRHLLEWKSSNCESS